ncbi:MAG: helix-turn-helix transcriptional regulator [Tyzzerella sp.]|nr:helix-turn-helix transcriptional regulator [Tyzzerella sp.]
MNEREKYNKIIFPDNLKHWREDSQLLQEEVAKKLGITVEEWKRMELGEKEMSNTFLIRLCKTFGVSSDEILFYHKKSFMDIAPVLSMRTLAEEEQEKIKLRKEEANSAPTANEP